MVGLLQLLSVLTCMYAIPRLARLLSVRWLAAGGERVSLRRTAKLLYWLSFMAVMVIGWTPAWDHSGWPLRLSPIVVAMAIFSTVFLVSVGLSSATDDGAGRRTKKSDDGIDQKR